MSEASTRRRAVRMRGRVPAGGATLAAIYVVTLTIIPSGLVVQGIPLSISVDTLVALLMGMCWLCAHIAGGLGIVKGFTPMRTAIYAFLLGTIATYAWAMHHYLPSDEIKLADHTLVLIIALIGMVLMIGDGVPNRERIDFLLRVVVVCCSIVAGVAALQFVIDFDMTKYLVLPGLKMTSINAGYIFERQDLRRVAGTTGNPIEFGVLCAMTMPLALYFAFRAKQEGSPAGRWWVCCALIGSGLLFSISRSAVLGMACAGLILMMGWPARRRVVSIIVTLVVLALSRFAFPGLIGTIVGLFVNFSSDDSVQYRTHDYPIAAAEISRHPILGRGVGTFYAPKHIVFDNQYLLTLVEGGFVGLVVMVLLFIVGFGSALYLALRAVRPQDRELALTLLAAVTVPAIGSVTFDLFGFKVVEGVFFALLGVVAAYYRMTPCRPVRLWRRAKNPVDRAMVAA
jgi:O-antigen ligase